MKGNRKSRQPATRIAPVSPRSHRSEGLGPSEYIGIQAISAIRSSQCMIWSIVWRSWDSLLPIDKMMMISRHSITVEHRRMLDSLEEVFKKSLALYEVSQMILVISKYSSALLGRYMKQKRNSLARQERKAILRTLLRLSQDMNAYLGRIALLIGSPQCCAQLWSISKWKFAILP